MKKIIPFVLAIIIIPVKINSQVTIADWDGTNETFYGFECTVNVPVTNPYPTSIDTSADVMQVTTSTSQFEVAYANLGYYIDFTNVGSISLKVHSDVAGEVVLKIANQANPDTYKVVSGYYSSPGSWQEIYFNFNCSGSDNNTYNQLSVFPDFNNTTRSNNWYFDDIRTLSIPPFAGDTISNFDNIIRIFVNWNTNGTSIVANPDSVGASINKTPECLEVISSADSFENILTVLESNLDFSHKNAISMMVFSDTAGIMVLKLRKPDGSNDVIKKYQYTTPGKWEKLTFDLTGTETNAYNSITIYPGFNSTLPDIKWFIDEITFDSVKIEPFTSDTICNFDEVIRIFEGWDSIKFSYIKNPYKTSIDTSNTVMKILTSTAPYEGIKTTLERNLDFTKYKSNLFSIKVYSEHTGAVNLKLFKEGDTTYIVRRATYITQGQWQQLTFDLSGVPSNVFDAIAIYPDHGGIQGGVAWFLDDLEIIHSVDHTLYSNWDGVEKPFSAIGDAVFTAPLVNPYKTGINTSDSVMEVTTTAQTKEGVKTALKQFIDFSVSSTFQIKVNSSVTGNVLLRLEGKGVAAREVSAYYRTANEWQLLDFNFGNGIQTDVYNMISILPDYGQVRSVNWYIDDLTGPRLTITPVILGKSYADWDSISPTLETWQSLLTSIVDNPLIAGIDTSAHVLETESNSSAYEGFAIKIPGVFDFINGKTFALKVKSDTAGQVLFKIESPVADPVSISLQYTKPGSWQQLVYTFDENLPAVYNKISIFPDFSNTGLTGSWHFDDIQGPKSIDTLMILTGTIAENHEDGKIITDTLIGDEFTAIINKNNWTITGYPAGVHTDTIVRINNSRADIHLKGNSGGKHDSDINVLVSVNKNQFVTSSKDLSSSFNIIAKGSYTVRDKKVFAHYLPWYHTTLQDSIMPIRAGWCSGKCDNLSNIDYSNKPLIGEYSQLDDDVLEYHFLTMYVAGIDGIIIDLNPSRPEQIKITLKCLNKLKEMHEKYQNFSMKFIIAYDQQDQTANIFNDFKYIKDSLTNNASFDSFRFNDDVTGNPVIMTWADFNLPLFSICIDSVYSKKVLYLKRDASAFKYSDGTFEWVNYLENNTDTSEKKYWGKNYFEDQEYEMANQHKKFIPAPDRNYLFMGAAWPGFDDHNAGWGEHRWINRYVEAGETMALTFDRQIKYVPGTDGPVYADLPWIQLVTWNDFPEGTSIEPGTLDTYGFNAIKTTQNKIADFKKIKTIDSSAVRIPYAIYLARKDGKNDIANCMIEQIMLGKRNYDSVSRHCCCDDIKIANKGINIGFDFDIFPNPGKKLANIIIHGKNEGDLKIEVFSNSGKLIQNTTLTDYNENSIYLLDIQNLENGIYLVRLGTSSTLITKKLIINK